MTARAIPKWLLGLLACEGLFVLLATWSWCSHGDLPAPLFYDPFDRFMDFYNTAYWSFQDGRYDVWHAVYPIFTFVLGQALNSGQCAQGSATMMRACEPWGVLSLFATYIAASIVSAICIAKSIWPAEPVLTVRRIGPLTLAILFCLPGLFALDRGNFLVYAYLLVALAVLWRRNWKSALLIAIAINLKPYLVVLWIAPLMKRDYRWLALCVVFALVVNALSMAWIGDPHYGLLFQDMTRFVSPEQTSYFEKVWYSVSFAAWVRAVGNSPHLTESAHHGLVHALEIGLAVLRWASALAVVAMWGMLWRRQRFIDSFTLAFCAVLGLIVLTDGPGGYACLLLIPFSGPLLARPTLHAFRWMFVLLIQPLDLAIGPSVILRTNEFWTDLAPHRVASLTIGAYVRPFLLVALVVYIGLITWRGRVAVGARPLNPDRDPALTPIVEPAGAAELNMAHS